MDFGPFARKSIEKIYENHWNSTVSSVFGGANLVSKLSRGLPRLERLREPLEGRRGRLLEAIGAGSDAALGEVQQMPPSRPVLASFRLAFAPETKRSL